MPLKGHGFNLVKNNQYIILIIPGPPHGLRVQEVRKNSMVLLWEPPTFNGRSPVTGYYVDYKEENGKWRCVQERSTKNTNMKVIHEFSHLFVQYVAQVLFL